MLRFQFLPAHHGDCFLVRWGNPERVMLVDGGPDQVYETVLRPYLKSLPNQTVDVLCLSHVDEDHVVGVMQLLRELARAKRDQLALPINVRRVWFNSVDDLVDKVQPGLATSARALVKSAPASTAMPASYAQGSEVRSSIAALGLGGNAPFNGPLITGSKHTLDKLDVTVVAPTNAALDKLVKRWQAAVQAKSAKVLAAAYKDRKVPNLSSIALYLHHAGRTALLTGDARGDHLISGLEATGLLAAGARMHVDVFKLPHHGSKSNAQPSLFDRIRADHYVICADGIRHKHPSTETLNWMVASRDKNDRYTVHLTQAIPAAQGILEKLRGGRKFTIEIGAPRIEIALPAIHGN